MQTNIFGLIYAAEKNDGALRDLVNKRSVSALPVGGRYRTVDFVLSNMVNTGIRNVGIIPRKNYQSLMDHLGSGKEWDLSRKNDGLFILPPYDTYENKASYHGLIDTVKGAAAYVRRAKQEYCLISAASLVYNTDYEDMVRRHKETGADITIMYNVQPAEKNTTVSSLVVDEDGRVVDFPVRTGMEEGNINANMSCYLIKKDLLVSLVDSAYNNRQFHFVDEVLKPALKTLKIYGYRYDGYVARYDNVRSYFANNMDFLNPEVQKDLFEGKNNIYTKVKDGAPAKYTDTAEVKNSILGSGCVIEGELENCVVFRNVKIHKGAKLKNCIIMQDTEIFEGACLDHVILDKHVAVRPHANLVGHRDYPIVIPKGGIV